MGATYDFPKPHRFVTVNKNYEFPPPLEARLAAKFVGKGELVVNVKDYGAKGDGVTDDTEALNTAANVAFGQRLLIPAGIYKTTGTLFVGGSLDAWDAQINYIGTGVAVQVGTSADLLMGKKISLPFVNHVGSGWDAGCIGIDLVNLYSSNIAFQRVKGFDTGLRGIGLLGRGFVYNTITVGYLDNNRVNLLLTHDQTGWINENIFVGGRYAHIETGSYGTVGDPNTHHIMLKRGSTTIGGPNNNVFLKPSLEGNPVDQYRVVFDGARYNAIVNGRWETAGAYPAKIKYTGASDFNRIEGGYDLWKVVEEFAAGTVGGTIHDGAGALVLLRSASVQTVLSGTTTVFSGWSPGASSLRRCTYAAGTFTPRPGDWNISAQVTFDSNATGIRRAWLKTTDGATLAIAECGPTGSARAVLKLDGRASFTGTNGFYVEVYQNSGADLATTGTTGYCTVNAQLAPV